MSTTARSLIKSALRKIGAVATGETPSAEEQADALEVLNDMIDSWSIENLIIYTETREEFDLVSGQDSYIFGTGGDFDSARPVVFRSAAIKQAGSELEIPVEILSPELWAAVFDKALQSSIPMKIYPSGTFPSETVYVWPVPSIASKLVLYTGKQITQFANANASVSLPPGYARALKFNLALELAGEYGKDPSKSVIAGALEGKANIKRKNIKPYLLSVDPGLLPSGRYNILLGK